MLSNPLLEAIELVLKTGMSDDQAVVPDDNELFKMAWKVYQKVPAVVLRGNELTAEVAAEIVHGHLSGGDYSHVTNDAVRRCLMR